jgi:SAM-dependent methyltransferase
MVIDRRLNYGRDHIKSFLESIKPFESAVDIGAGTGVDLGLVKEVCPAAQVVGLEVYKPYIQSLARRGWKILYVNIERDPFPFEKESIDVFLANQVLEHLKEIFWIFHQISLALKVGGHLILGVPNLASLHNRILLALGRQPVSIAVQSAHVRGFTGGGIKSFLLEAGRGLYAVKKIKGANFYPFPPFLARPLAALFPNFAWGLFFLVQKTRPYGNEFIDFAAPGRLESNFFVGE